MPMSDTLPLPGPCHPDPAKSAAWRRQLWTLTLAASAAAAMLLPAAARAHHGWAWAEGENSELTGTVTATKLGNPHGELTVEVDGQPWIVEVGQPWRNQRVGLSDDMLAPGAKLRVTGHRHADPAKKVFKAERVYLGEKRYDLYPDRD